MAGDTKTELRSHIVTDFRHFVAGELEKLTTVRAIQVIVLRISIVKLVNRPTIQLKTLQQPRVQQTLAKFGRRSPN